MFYMGSHSLLMVISQDKGFCTHLHPLSRQKEWGSKRLSNFPSSWKGFDLNLHCWLLMLWLHFHLFTFSLKCKILCWLSSCHAQRVKLCSHSFLNPSISSLLPVQHFHHPEGPRRDKWAGILTVILSRIHVSSNSHSFTASTSKPWLDSSAHQEIYQKS